MSWKAMLLILAAALAMIAFCVDLDEATPDVTIIDCEPGGECTGTFDVTSGKTLIFRWRKDG